MSTVVKPRFSSLSDCVAGIKVAVSNGMDNLKAELREEIRMEQETRIWQTMQQRDVQTGGGWDK